MKKLPTKLPSTSLKKKLSRSAEAVKFWDKSNFGGSLVLLIAGIVILALGIHYFSNKPAAKQSSNNASSSVTTPSGSQVSISPTGFIPQTITLKAGTQLTWTNNDTSPHQVAADPYPSNNSIPGFDSTIVLHAGDSYSFTFVVPGTYHLHDQLNPMNINGTVVVN